MPTPPLDPRRSTDRPVAKGWIAALPIVVFFIIFTTISFGMALSAYQHGAPWIFVLAPAGIGVVGLCAGASSAYSAYFGRRSPPPAPHDTDPPASPRSTALGSPSPCAYCGRVVPADQIACPGCGSPIER
jgi:hypothetical protein